MAASEEGVIGMFLIAFSSPFGRYLSGQIKDHIVYDAAERVGRKVRNIEEQLWERRGGQDSVVYALFRRGGIPFLAGFLLL